MKKIQLKIGALSLSIGRGVSSYFFFYSERGGKCIKIKLDPANINALISNLSYRKGVPTIQMVFSSVLKNYSISLEEANLIAIGRGKSLTFNIELLFVPKHSAVKDKFRTIASFGDGMALVKLFGIPLYIDKETFNKYAIESIDTKEYLKFKLQKAEEAESLPPC